MTANTEITELIRSELCRFLQDACAGKTGVKLDMDNPAAEVSAPLGFVTGYTAQFWAERLTGQAQAVPFWRAANRWCNRRERPCGVPYIHSGI